MVFADINNTMPQTPPEKKSKFFPTWLKRVLSIGGSIAGVATVLAILANGWIYLDQKYYDENDVKVELQILLDKHLRNHHGYFHSPSPPTKQ